MLYMTAFLNRIRVLATIVLFFAAAFFAAPNVSLATSGACSYHGGVSCASGPDWDGSVICSDGWRDSSVSYSSMAMCRSYGGSTYSYTSSIPSCPFMASYNSLSGACECAYGYVASGGSCVSRDQLCHDQLGYSSSYDSVSGMCKCSYGYVIGSSGQCTSGTLYCAAKIGLMSQYNSATKQCECMAGYEFDGSTCAYKRASYQSYSSAAYAGSYAAASASKTTYSCPVNSHESPTDSTKCVCDTGYVINLDKSACMPPLTINQPIAPPAAPAAGVVVAASKDFAVPNSDITAADFQGAVKSTATFRTCPSTDCSVIRYFAARSVIKVTGIYKKGGWYQIAATTEPGGKGNKVVGWVSQSLVQKK